MGKIGRKIKLYVGGMGKMLKEFEKANKDIKMLLASCEQLEREIKGLIEDQKMDQSFI